MFQEEDIGKLVEKDMGQIGPVLKENKINDNGQIKKQIRNFYVAFKNYVVSDGNLYLTNLFINGALFRCHELYKGVFASIKDKSIHMNSYALRAVAETLALVHYCLINPYYLKSSLIGSREEEDENKIINIKTMIDKLEIKRNGISEDYESLSHYVHPNPKSLFSSFAMEESNGDKPKFRASFGGNPPKFDEKMVSTSVNLLLRWTNWFFEEIRDLNKKSPM